MFFTGACTLLDFDRAEFHLDPVTHDGISNIWTKNSFIKKNYYRIFTAFLHNDNHNYKICLYLDKLAKKSRTYLHLKS